MFNWIKSLFFKRPNYKIQSFTFYIPAPGARKVGYREKQFDKVFYHFINQGYEILNVQTQPHNGPETSGMWIIYTVQATNAESSNLNLEDYFMDQVPGIQNAGPEGLQEGLQEELQKEEIEGLYYID